MFMNETLMRAIFLRKLKPIAQEPDVFCTRVGSLDGAEVSVHLFLVLGLPVFADENLQSNILMISKWVSVSFREW
jgi:hypothetical protein